MKDAKIRLFVDQPISDGQSLSLTGAQAQYLFAVMRLRAGGRIAIFDGGSGEWLAEILELSKRGGVMRAMSLRRAQSGAADVWMCFAPLKKARMDMVVEKATEMGVSCLVPVLCAFANSDRLRIDRMRAQAIEAAEQCGAMAVPQVADPVRIEKLMTAWPAERTLLFCDETLAGGSMAAFSKAQQPAAILVGPEGGFAPSERAMLREHPNCHSVALGPRILRAETAALAALALWQAQCGDWQSDQ